MATGRLEKYPIAGEYQDKLSDTGWQSLTNPTMYSGTIRYRVWGDVVTVQAWQLTLVSNLIAGAYRTIHTSALSSAVPKDYVSTIGGNYNKTMQIAITTAGNIIVYAPADSAWTTTDNINFTVTYLKA